MKKILVPTDFSPCANNALEVAIKVAAKSGNEITLLTISDYSAHISSIYDMGLNEALLVDVFEKLKKDSEEKMADIIAKTASPVAIHSKVEVGIPKDVILSFLESGEYELVVMGTKGTSGISEIFVGSNTERIVRDAKVPVLSVNETVGDFNPKKIVFASEFEGEVGEKFDDLVWFSSLFDAEINLVRINTPSNFKNTISAEKAMEKFAKAYSLKRYSMTQFDYEQFEAGLNRYLKRENADMVAMGTHGRKGLKYFYYGGSKAEDVVNHFDIPVFTFKITG